MFIGPVGAVVFLVLARLIFDGFRKWFTPPSPEVWGIAKVKLNMGSGREIVANHCILKRIDREFTMSDLVVTRYTFDAICYGREEI